MSECPLCPTCQHTERSCPLAGMTDTMDEPLYGNMIQCIHYLPKDQQVEEVAND